MKSSIFSLKFSGNGKELLAATKDSKLMIYDLFTDKVSISVKDAHKDTLNSACYAHKDSP